MEASGYWLPYRGKNIDQIRDSSIQNYTEPFLTKLSAGHSMEPWISRVFPLNFGYHENSRTVQGG